MLTFDVCSFTCFYCARGAYTASPRDGMTGDMCSSESSCPTGSCKQQ